MIKASIIFEIPVLFDPFVLKSMVKIANFWCCMNVRNGWDIRVKQLF